VTAILAHSGDAGRIAESLRGARRIAIDTEFHAERRYLPELYLVQLHVDRGEPGGPTWIVDPLDGDLLARVAPDLLAVPWIVHGGEQDLRVLSVALGGLPDQVDDTQIAAGLLSDHWPAPYASLVEHHLGTTLEKGETLSDWSKRPLTPAQLTYAALDVELLIPLWDRLAARLAERGRTELARRACDEARAVGLDGPDDGEAFRALPVVPTMAPEQLLVLQELAAWRLERARATNQPVRAVLSDGVLMDLARRQPTTTGALLANRRLPRGMARDAPELIERIARARNRPGWAIPKVVRRRTAEWRAAQWLQVWAEDLGAEREFAAGLVLPRPLIERLVLDPPASRDDLSRALGWRDPLLGDDLHRAQRGDVSLSLRGGQLIRAEHAAAVSSRDPELEKNS
jgi:ribonuclease D